MRNDPGDGWWCKWGVKIKVCAVTDSVMGDVIKVRSDLGAVADSLVEGVIRR